MRERDLFAAYGITAPPRITPGYRIKCRVPSCPTLIDQLMTNRTICRFHLRKQAEAQYGLSDARRLR